MKTAGTETRHRPRNEKLQALAAALPPWVPPNYLIFFERFDGAEILFDDVDWERDPFDYLRLNSIDEILNPITRAALSELFPDLFVIVDDGGGQVIGYDMNWPSPSPIVIHLPGFTEAHTRPVVAASMAELMRMFLPA